MRYRIPVLFFYGSALLAAGALGWNSAEPQPPAQFRALDGDSLISASGDRFRLFGIDAPELFQQCFRDARAWPCGLAAKNELQATLDQGQPIRCLPEGRDKYNRALVTCYTNLNLDINAHMVRSGNAVAYTRYSYRYEIAEARAKEAQRGIWAGTFTLPEEYRQEHPRGH